MPDDLTREFMPARFTGSKIDELPRAGTGHNDATRKRIDAGTRKSTATSLMPGLISFEGLDCVSGNGHAGSDHYHLQLWPAPMGPAQVLKQGV